MKRVLVFVIFISVFFISNSCSNKSDGIVFPSASVNLLFPTNNLLCIDNAITFDWSDAEDNPSGNIIYNIIIAKDRSLTDIVENTTTLNSEITLTLEKGIAYYWKIIVTDTANNSSTDSQIFSFYTKGDGILNYTPFVAQLVSPAQNGQVNPGSTTLTWTGSDADVGDTLTYELYFGETNTPTIIENALTTETHAITVETGKTYYWKINTVDQNSAKSIGQVWSFNVN